MKQTAVEWLEEFMTNGKRKSIGIISLACAKAKEMEKEQIMNAWMHGFEEIQPYIDSSEDYYNETFKSE